MAACQTAALRKTVPGYQSLRCRQPRRRPAAPVRAGPAPQEQREAEAAEAPAVPAVGWLWDKKSADTKKRLQQQNIRPKKSMGQNFMLDDSVLTAIVDAAGVGPGDLVLEIGPGTGNLTRHLLAAGARVTAVEKDEALSARLATEFAEMPQLRLVVGDILLQDLPRLLADMRQQAGQQAGQQAAAAAQEQQQDVQQPAATSPSQQSQQQSKVQVKVVANLPYYITKDCLLQMLPLGADISHLYFMLQDEVGVRLTQVQPGGPDWRAMNLLTQYYCRAQYLFQIDRTKYLPAPKVHGAVVEFALVPPEQRLAVPSEAGFLKLVRKAFSQRRKVVRNALRPMHEPAKVAAALEEGGLRLDARAQDLTLQQFADLAWRLEGAHPQAEEEALQALAQLEAERQQQQQQQ